MEMYIGKNKFHFITDYSKHACKNTNGEDIILDFGLLTIEERIMLSSYLTILCNKKDANKYNFYEIIFNFNSKKQRKTSYYNSFIEDLTAFLKNKPHYFTFIKDNFDKIENNKTFIYRQQLNASEMEVLYSLKFQRNYSSLMNVLYIIGVAKQNITTAALNHISLKRIYHSASPSVAKKRTIEIFNKLNEVSKKEIKYKFEGKEVFFGNGFSIEEEEKFYSNEKKDFNRNQKLEDWLNSIQEENKIEQPVALDKEAKQVELPKEKEIEEEIAIKMDKEVIQEKKINFTSIVDLSDDHAGRFSIEIFKNVQEYIDNDKHFLIQQWDEILTKNYSYDEKTKIYRYFSENYLNVNDEIAKCKELIKVLNNASLGENWKEIKDKAREQAFTIQNKICSKLNKLFDDENDKDHIKYETAILQCLKYYKNILFYNK